MALVYITFLNETVEAGAALKGIVNVKVDKTIKFKVLELRFKGEASVDDGSEIGERESVLKETFVLRGKGSTQDSSTTNLCQGLHMFPFECYLPQGLPPSYEYDGFDLEAKITYEAICKLEVQERWVNTSSLGFKTFKVHTTLDLNSNRSYSQSVQKTNEILLSSLCCKKGLLSATFCLDRQGYVPGEEIRPKVKISNDSPWKIKKLHVQLKQVEIYHETWGLHSPVKRIVASTTRDGLSSYSKDVWLDGRLEVPPLTPSILHGCKLMTLEYVVQLVVVPEGVWGKLKIPLDVVIGTVPLMQQPQIDLAPECYNGQSSIQDSTDEHTQGVLY